MTTEAIKGAINFHREDDDVRIESVRFGAAPYLPRVGDRVFLPSAGSNYVVRWVTHSYEPVDPDDNEARLHSVRVTVK